MGYRTRCRRTAAVPTTNVAMNVDVALFDREVRGVKLPPLPVSVLEARLDYFFRRPQETSVNQVDFERPGVERSDSGVQREHVSD